VRSIAEAHGGRAGAANGPGGGADVWIALPADRPPARVTTAIGRAGAA
jgi:signal transduction histidine kinase